MNIITQIHQYSKKLPDGIRLVFLVFILAAIVLSLFLVSKTSRYRTGAQDATMAIEPEAGTVFVPATVGTDSTASNSKYVQFSPPLSTPAPTSGSTPTPGSGFISNLVTDPNAVFPVPQVAKPGYLTSIIDPTFHTKITRIAGDANTGITFTNGSGTWGADARQHYNDDQPWNADSSLLLLQNSGSPSQVILDGSTYQPKYTKCSGYSPSDDRWHPTLPNVRINVSGTKLEWYDVVNCVLKRSWTLPFSAQDIESSISSDGRFMVLHDSTNVVVVDMDPPTPLPAYCNGNSSKCFGPIFNYASTSNGCTLESDCYADFVGLSPDAKYTVVSYHGDHQRVFDINPTTLEITPHAVSNTALECGTGHDPAKGYIYDLGHAALALNPYDNNSAVIIGQNRDWCPQTVDGVAMGQTIMVRLRDGLVKTLTKAGNEAQAYHNSTQNTLFPGWVYVSHYPASGKRFDDEIIAVKLDGSGSVMRLAHDHTDTSGCYRCEAHLVPSRDGRRVIFASSWSENCTSCGSTNNPQAYIVDARAPLASAPHIGGSVAGVTADDEIHYTITGPTSVTLSWRGADSALRYGTTTAYGQTFTATNPTPAPFSSPGPFWEAKLTGLQANTLYHYSIGGSPDYTFKTALPKGSSGFTIDAIGDVGDSTSYSNVTPIQQLIAAGRPDLVLVAGDITYGDSHGLAVVDQHFNDIQAWSLGATAYMPAWGNHDWGDNVSPPLDDLRNLKGRFDLPNSQTSPGSPSISCCGEDWYYFDYGNTRFITYPEPWSGALSDWNTKATAMMDAAQADPGINFIVTFGHRPAYSSGHHPGESTLKGYLDSLGSSHSKYVLNLNGHSHNYERTLPQHGVVHLTVGTGGAGLEQDNESCLWFLCTQPAWSAKRYMRQGFTRLAFTSTGISGSFICGPAGGGTNDIACSPGDIIDSFTIGSPTTPSITPLTTPIVSSPTPTPTACPPVPSAENVAISAITVNSPSTYRVWSRIMGQGDSANSYWLQVDSSCAITVGDLVGFPTNSWTWVDYQNGVSTNKISLTLSPGTHTIKMIGKEPGVKLDRLILDSSATCLPTGTGDNCLVSATNTPTPLAVPTATNTPMPTSAVTQPIFPTTTPTPIPAIDITPPTVTITNPTNGSTLSNKGSVKIAAKASDASGINKIEIYLDTVLLRYCSFNTSCQTNLRLSQVTSGAHTILVQATDNSSNKNVGKNSIIVTKP